MKTREGDALWLDSVASRKRATGSGRHTWLTYQGQRSFVQAQEASAYREEKGCEVCSRNHVGGSWGWNHLYLDEECSRSLDGVIYLYKILFPKLDGAGHWVYTLPIIFYMYKVLIFVNLKTLFFFFFLLSVVRMACEQGGLS